MDLAQGVRKLEELERDLRDPRDLELGYLEELRRLAQRAASYRPTPQARMAATALVVRGDVLSTPSSSVVYGRGGAALAGDIAGGSEWGSGIFRQFGPRRGSRGAWLGQAMVDPALDQAGDELLEDLVEGAIR